MTQRTYLCPACDGHGAFNDNTTGDPQLDTCDDCPDCDSTGVIQAEAGRYDLQPWTGAAGRVLARNSAPRYDWWRQLAHCRALCVQHRIRSGAYKQACRALFAPSGAFGLVDARAQRIAAARESREQEARMLEAAGRCVAAAQAGVEAMRRAAA